MIRPCVARIPCVPARPMSTLVKKPPPDLPKPVPTKLEQNYRKMQAKCKIFEKHKNVIHITPESLDAALKKEEENRKHSIYG